MYMYLHCTYNIISCQFSDAMYMYIRHIYARLVQVTCMLVRVVSNVGQWQGTQNCCFIRASALMILDVTFCDIPPHLWSSNNLFIHSHNCCCTLFDVHVACLSFTQSVQYTLGPIVDDSLSLPPSLHCTYTYSLSRTRAYNIHQYMGFPLKSRVSYFLHCAYVWLSPGSIKTHH